MRWSRRFGQSLSRVIGRPTLRSGWRGGLAGSLLVGWWMTSSFAATAAPCQESLMRMLTQLYMAGSYCTCASVYQATVSEKGRIRHQETYVLPGLSLGQSRFLPDLSQVQTRLWATIVDGPEGLYGLSVRIQEDGQKAVTMSRRLERLKKGEEFEITDGPQHPMRLRTRVPYQFTVEARNPHLRPAQLLTVEGRACLYFVSGS